MNFVKHGLRYSKIFTYFDSNVTPLLVLPVDNVIIFKVHPNLFQSTSVLWIETTPLSTIFCLYVKNNNRKKTKTKTKTKYFVAAFASTFSLLLASCIANLRYISCNLHVRLKEK